MGQTVSRNSSFQKQLNCSFITSLVSGSSGSGNGSDLNKLWVFGVVGPVFATTHICATSNSR